MLNHWTTTFFFAWYKLLSTLLYQIKLIAHIHKSKLKLIAQGWMRSNSFTYGWLGANPLANRQPKSNSLACGWRRSNPIPRLWSKNLHFFLHQKMPKSGNFSMLIIHYINNKWKKTPNKCLTIIQSTTSLHLMTEPMHMSEHKHDIQHKFGTSH